MATLEELDFTLKIDSKEFDNKVEDVKKAAKELNIDVSKYLDLKITLNKSSVGAFKKDIDNLIKSMNKVNVKVKVPSVTQNSVNNQQKINDETKKYISILHEATSAYQQLNNNRAAGIIMTQEHLEQIAQKINEITGSTGTNASRASNSILGETTSVMKNLITLGATYFSVAGVKSFISELVQVTGEFEKQRIALGAILKDYSTANRIFEQIKTLAVESPFQVKELVTYAKQLTAYAIPAKELYQTTKMLADVSAGLGVDMNRLVLAYGQIRSASFLRGQEVRQLTESGIPILQELSKQISEFEGRAVSVSEVFDRISNRQVTFEMVKKVFTDMTSEGGKFYKMQETIAQTLSGKISNLKDAWEIMLDEIGRGNNVVLTGTVDLLRKMMPYMDEIVKIIGSIITGLTALGLKSIKWKSIISLLGSTASKFTAIIAGVTYLTIKIIDWAKATDSLSESLDIVDKHIRDFESLVSSEDIQLRKLFDSLKNASAATGEYDKIKSQILSKYDQYITAIDKENLSLGRQAEAYQNIKKAIIEANISKANEAAIQELTSKRQEQVQPYLEKVDETRSRFEKGGKIFSNEAWNEYKSYLNGLVEENKLHEETIKLIDVINKDWNSIQNQIKYTATTGIKVNSDLGINTNLFVERISAINDNFNQSIDKLTEYFKSEDAVLTGERKVIDELVGSRKNIGWGEQETWQDYIDRLSGQYKKNREVIESYKKLLDEAKKDYSKGRISKSDLEEYQKQLEINIEEQNLIQKIAEKYSLSLDKKESKTKSRDISSEIKNIQAEISIYRKLRSEAEKIKAINKDWNEETINDKLREYFSLDTKYIGANYDAKIEELVNKARKLALNPLISDADKTSLITIAVGYEQDKFNAWISELEKAQKEIEKFRLKYEELKKSFNTSFELKGVGAIYDISKDVKAYSDAFDKIMQKKQEAIDALNKTDKVESDKFFELNALETLSGQELDNALATLKDKLNTDGGKIFKEFLDTLGLPDGEWSKINPFKRFKISKMLKNVFDNEGLQKQRQVIEEMLKASGKFSQTQIDELLKPLDKGIGDEAGNALNKLKNLGRQDIEYIARNIKELTSSLTQYAEASGDSRLQEGIDVVGLLAQVGQDFAKKDWAGVVTQSAKALINTIISEISYTKQLEAQIKKTRHEVDLLDWTNMLDTDTIFGDDLIKKMSQASKVLEQINGKYQSLTDNLRNQSIGGDVVQGIESFIFSLGNIPFAIQNSMGKINAFDEAIKKGYKDLETYIVKFNDRSGLANLFGFADQYNNLRDLFASVGFDSTELGAFRSMYDKYGNLNTEGLQKILDTYDRLSNEDRAWMEEAIDYADAYKEAMDEVYSTLENVYGGAVSDLTDLMIDNWIKAGDAAGNYSNILSDVAKNYAKLMIQNTLLDKIFNEELQGKFADAFLKGDSTSAMRLFVDAIDSIEEYIPTINEILQGINNEIPLLEESSDTLSSGIKSITEETASLLASYVNAIRADVSYNKLTLKDINNDVKAILGLLPTTPTLTMYLTQIQANTYNTQLATERVVSETHNILTEIQSVIGTESGTTAIRVSM